MLRGQFVALQTYLKKQDRNHTNNLTLHLKQLEEEQMKNPRVSGRKEIMKFREEIKENETKEKYSKNQQY